MFLSKNIWSVLRLHFCLLLLWTKMIKKRFCSRKTSCLKAGVAPNLHFPHIHQTQIYTNPRFTWDPNLHKPGFTRNPYLHSTDLHKSIFAHRFQETQIYTKSKFTQHNFTQNPNLQKTVSSNFASNYIKWIPLLTLVS